MMQKVEYTRQEIIQTLTTLLHIFDLVRVVDPALGKEYRMVDGNIVLSDYRCFSAWAADTRCKNCASTRALRDRVRATKLEFINRDIFYVVAQYVVIEGRELVLEIVSNVTDHLMLEALGNDEFVSRIIAYNRDFQTDAVSGISNRRYFDEQAFLLAKRAAPDDLLALVIIDIDDFKDVNDRYGHAMGDGVIRTVAQLLQSKFSRSEDDIVARIGGDELAVMLSKIPPATLRRRLDELSDEVPAACEKALGVPVTVSIGAAIRTADACRHNVSELFKLADEALYRVKRGQKGRVMLDG